MLPKKSMRIFVRYPFEQQEAVALPGEYADYKVAVEIAKSVVANLKEHDYTATYQVQVRQAPFGPEDYVWSDERLDLEVDPLR